MLRKVFVIKVFWFTLFLSQSSLDATGQKMNVLFSFDSDVLRLNDISKLDILINTYKVKNGTFLLSGHTDTAGNDDYNLNLSKKRVEAIKQYLIQHGIEEARIETTFHGENILASEEQLFNRRVEVLYEEKDKPIRSFEDFKLALKPIKQNFYFDPEDTIQIEGDQGTLIEMESGILVHQNGEKVQGAIEIQLTEYYTYSDFYSANLATLSNNELIESNGMVYIQAFGDGKELVVKEGMSYTIHFPKQSSHFFEAFYGHRDQEGVMQWEADTNMLEYFVKFGEEKSFSTNRNHVSDVLEIKRVDTLDYYDPDYMAKMVGYTKHEEQQKVVQKNLDLYYQTIVVNRLQNINCDRFLNTDKVKIKIEVTNKDLMAVTYTLFFKNIKSLLTLDLKSEKKDKLRLPIDEEVTLRITGIHPQTRTPYMYEKEMTIAQNMEEKVTLTKTSFDNLKFK